MAAILCRTHVCGDSARLGEHDGEVEERCTEEQAGGTDQRVSSGRLLSQLPAHLHAAGHAQHAGDAGDGPKNQTWGEKNPNHQNAAFLHRGRV